MKRVIGMHFVCKDDLNVVENGNGTFDTGFWYVARKHAATTEYVALHEGRAFRSYRQGRVVSWRVVLHEGKTRVIFRVREDVRSREWVGDGTGERGYCWG